MTEINNKVLTLFEGFYRIILLNLLFLITNSFLFQVFFFIDFQVIYFPVYFVVSIPLIPSLIALLRSIDKIKTGKETKLVSTYLQELLFTVKHEYRIWGCLLITFFMTLTTLYTATITGAVTFLFYVLNILLLVAEGVLLVNLLFNGLAFQKSQLTKNIFLSFLSNAVRNMVILIVILMGIVLAFNVSFSMILFIFGGLLEVMYRAFINRKRV